MLEKITALIIPQNKNIKNNPTAVQIKVAFAQFALFGLVPAENPHTKSIMKPMKGMKLINKVITQSPIGMG